MLSVIRLLELKPRSEQKIEHIVAQIANAMLAGGLLNYFIVGL